jgi:hypothetical protein
MDALKSDATGASAAPQLSEAHTARRLSEPLEIVPDSEPERQSQEFTTTDGSPVEVARILSEPIYISSDSSDGGDDSSDSLPRCVRVRLIGE